jgi:hypothetical protein
MTQNFTPGASSSNGVRLLSDAPLDDLELDYFRFAYFARALAEILDNERTATPLTVAVSAPWGAGKTSVARMVQTLLRGWVAERDGDRPRIVCWFNAWDHDDAPHLGAALAALVAREADRRRALWRRVLTPLPAAMLSSQARWRRVVLAGAAALAVAVFLALLHSTQELAATIAGVRKSSDVPGLGWVGIVALVWVLWRRLFAAASDAARFVDDPRSAAAHGAMAQVSDQLGRLIRQARRGGRMIIVVDDIERCRPGRALEVFQVAGQLLGHDGVATLLLADMRTIERAAESAYSGAERAGGLGGVGRRYMQKLLQLEVVLPPPRREDVGRLLRGVPPQPDAARRGAAAPRHSGRGGGAARTPQRLARVSLACRAEDGHRRLHGLRRDRERRPGQRPGRIRRRVDGLDRDRGLRLGAPAAAQARARARGAQRRGRDRERRRHRLGGAQAGRCRGRLRDLESYALKAAESYLTVRGPEIARLIRFEPAPPPTEVSERPPAPTIVR